MGHLTIELNLNKEAWSPRHLSVTGWVTGLTCASGPLVPPHVGGVVGVDLAVLGGADV